MAIMNKDASGVGKYVPSVFVIEIEGIGGFSPTSGSAMNPKQAAAILREYQAQHPEGEYRVAEYVRLQPEGCASCL